MLVNLPDGEIGVDSEQRKGSKFTITLPISVKISFSIRCYHPDQQEEQFDAQRSSH
jgi:chemotaxis protein histidine kinase CheA